MNAALVFIELPAGAVDYHTADNSESPGVHVLDADGDTLAVYPLADEGRIVESLDSVPVRS